MNKFTIFFILTTLSFDILASVRVVMDNLRYVSSPGGTVQFSNGDNITASLTLEVNPLLKPFHIICNSTYSVISSFGQITSAEVNSFFGGFKDGCNTASTYIYTFKKNSNSLSVYNNGINSTATTLEENNIILAIDPSTDSFVPGSYSKTMSMIADNVIPGLPINDPITIGHWESSISPYGSNFGVNQYLNVLPYGYNSGIIQTISSSNYNTYCGGGNTIDLLKETLTITNNINAETATVNNTLKANCFPVDSSGFDIVSINHIHGGFNDIDIGSLNIGDKKTIPVVISIKGARYQPSHSHDLTLTGDDAQSWTRVYLMLNGSSFDAGTTNEIDGVKVSWSSGYYQNSKLSSGEPNRLGFTDYSTLADTSLTTIESYTEEETINIELENLTNSTPGKHSINFTIVMEVI